MQLIVQSVAALPMNKFFSFCARKADDADGEASRTLLSKATQVRTTEGASPDQRVSFTLSKFQVNTSKGAYGG